jgi:hypothetical protein
MEWLTAEHFFALTMGLGLSAACGFRIFVPLMLMSLMGNIGWVSLPSELMWAGTPVALLMLASATMIEVVAYYIPWLDNALDTLATPLAMVAGTLVTLGFAPEMSPLAQWSLALIAGGGLAGLTQGATVATRAASTATTGGLGNPIVSTLEAVFALCISLLAMAAPVLTLLVVLGVLVWAIIKISVYFKGKTEGSKLQVKS